MNQRTDAQILDDSTITAIIRATSARHASAGAEIGLDADEIASAAAEGIARAIARIDPAKARNGARAYAEKAANNRVRMLLRSQRRRRAHRVETANYGTIHDLAALEDRGELDLGTATQAREPDPPASLIDDETRERLANARQTLDSLTRAIVAGRFDRGMSRRAVADDLGISVDRVRIIEQRAMRTLRKAMSAKGNGAGADGANTDAGDEAWDTRPPLHHTPAILAATRMRRAPAPSARWRRRTTRRAQRVARLRISFARRLQAQQHDAHHSSSSTRVRGPRHGAPRDRTRRRRQRVGGGGRRGGWTGRAGLRRGACG